MTIEELKQALEAATPGPWEILDGNEIHSAPIKAMNYQRREMVADAWGTDGLDQANTHLIVEAVNNLPKLLAVAEAAEKYRHAMEGFDEAVRLYTGKPLPWEPGDIAAEALTKALEELK